LIATIRMRFGRDRKEVEKKLRRFLAAWTVIACYAASEWRLCADTVEKVAG